jgi:hypothetical protein
VDSLGVNVDKRGISVNGAVDFDGIHIEKEKVFWTKV